MGTKFNGQIAIIKNFPLINLYRVSIENPSKCRRLIEHAAYQIYYFLFSGDKIALIS